MNKDKIKKDLKEIETINIELDHRVSKLIAENEHLKQTYKQLYDSIKPARIRSKEQSLKDDLRKLKEKYLVDNDVTKQPSYPEMLKIDMEPITPKLMNKRTAHSAYIKHTQEEAAVLRDLIDHVKANYPLDHTLDSTCRYKHTIDPEMLKIDVESITPKLLNNKTAHSACIKHTQEEAAVLKDLVEHIKANYPLIIQRNLHVKISKRKVWKPTRKVFTNIGYIWRPTGRTFTIVGNACPLTRITTTAEVPLRKPTALESDTPKPVVTLVYSRKPKRSKTNVPISKPKNIKSLYANKKEPSKSWGSIVSDVPSSSLNESRSSKLFSGIWTPAAPSICTGIDHPTHHSKISFLGNLTNRNDHMEKILMISQFYDSNLEVAFRQHTYFICNLEGVDLLTGSQGNNLYTLSLGDMMESSPICLLSKASKTKSWLWHRRLSHLNFSAINHLARHSLIRGLPKLKFEKDYLCFACAMGKS
ncbi:retrovirus-related pol polyprotein from transposon TNT 1-94 [Tanacetum coccineum]|uniref:Retrovirus-related pol polyprotein from transposon TNT 1-94 n=1 Tax=Tanacetum coccineum TaxID=301880 RepID=A0ABQ5EF04_9ASTR